MRTILIIVLLTCACISHAQVSIITTIAGCDDTSAYCCDGGPATKAKLYVPEYVCLDNHGNAIIGDCGNQRVRMISATTGIITTVGGNGTAGYNGDTISATDAELAVPEGVAADSVGNIYVADAGNHRIRRIASSTGIITTIAGNGVPGFAGDGGAAIDAQLYYPVGLCIDRSGNIYIGDYSNNKVRRVDAITGIITTFAGKQPSSPYFGGYLGYSGDGSPATNAVISGPSQVFADSVGNIFICDQWNHAIRKVDILTGIISTIAGTGTAGYSGDAGLAIHAQMSQPTGMGMDDKGNIFVAEYGNGVVRKIDAATGIISTVAGTGVLGFSGDGGAATNAKLRCGDVAVDNNGVIYIADEDNNRIRKVDNPKLGVPASPVLSKGEVMLYPNPARDEINVAYDFSEDGSIQITDMVGRVVIAKNLSSKKQREEVDVRGIAPGLYLYNVMQNGVLVSVGKIVKE